MKILVTGSAGFIGSYLCRALISRGDSVFGIDNFEPYYAKKAKEFNCDLINLHAGKKAKYIKDKNLLEVYKLVADSPLYKKSLKAGSYKFIKGDIRNLDFLEKIFKKEKFNAVIHLAAMAGVPKSLEKPQYYSQVNLEGTINLLDLSKSYNVKKFIFGSSSSVYGDRAKVPFRESEDISRPVSPYAATKVAGEAICYTYHHLFDLSTVIIRIFGPIYGPLQRPYGMFLQRAIKFIDNDLPVTIYGRDGWKMSRDCTYIDDEVRGIIQALDEKLDFEVINVGSGKPKSLKEQLNAVEKAMVKKAKVKYTSKKKTEVLKTCADISKAKKILRWRPRMDFKKGVKKQYEVYNLMPDWYKAVEKI